MVDARLNAWDLFVFPSGYRCYRVNGYAIPQEAQVFPVLHPNYRDEVAEMRKQVREHWKESERLPSAEELRRRQERYAFDINRCHCPQSTRGMEGNKNALRKPVPPIPVEKLPEGYSRHYLRDE